MSERDTSHQAYVAEKARVAREREEQGIRDRQRREDAERESARQRVEIAAHAAFTAAGGDAADWERRREAILREAQAAAAVEAATVGLDGMTRQQREHMRNGIQKLF